MKTKMTVNGISVCPTGEERQKYFTLNGFVNPTTDTRTANCSPASPRHWRSAEQNGIHG